MKNLTKSMLFILIFILIYIGLSFLFLPKKFLFDYGLYKTSMYDILDENKNTIDTIILGDSLVYSSVTPMDIYGEYGFTVFDCSQPAQIISDAYEYLKVAVETQSPKVVILEPNILFRDPNKRPWYDRPYKTIKNYFPLISYHNNWKKLFYSGNHNPKKTNVEKGYKRNIDINPSKNYDYMTLNKKSRRIPKENFEYLEKIIDYCKKNNIKLVFMAFPSQKSWNYKKHDAMNEIASRYNIEYINLNLVDSLNIDWRTETKDFGSHLNFYGAKKVSSYIGDYLNSLNLLENHKKQKGYEIWDSAYKYYSNI